MTETQNKIVDDILIMFDIQEGSTGNPDTNESYGDSEGKGKIPFEESLADYGDAIKTEAKDVIELQIKSEPQKTEPVKIVEHKSSTPGPETPKVIEHRSPTSGSETPKVVDRPYILDMISTESPGIPKIEEKSGKDLIKESISPTPESIDTNELDEASGDDIFATVETKTEEKADIKGSNENSVSYGLEKTPEKQKNAEESPQEPIPFDSPIVGEDGSPTETGSETKMNTLDTSLPQGWLLNSPSDKFRSFYQAKAEILKDLLEDGEILFTVYRKELSEAKVDPYVSSFDSDEITRRMGDAVKWTSRIAYIFVKVSTQLCIGERGLELLRGVLARIEYEKPKERNEGIVFEHMRDLEMYVAKMKSLSNITEFTIKMLEKAWNTLSRQLSVILGDKDKIEKHETGRSLYTKSSAPSLGTQGSSVSETSKTGDNISGIEGTTQELSIQQVKGSQTVEWDAIK